MDRNWEGAGGRGDHRTVGPHRAWCSCTGEWCYPHDLCRCCDLVRLPERWRGMNVGDVLLELRDEVAGLPTLVRDADEATYVRIDDVLDLLDDGRPAEPPTLTDLVTFPDARKHMDCEPNHCLVGDGECRKHWWLTP